MFSSKNCFIWGVVCFLLLLPFTPVVQGFTIDATAAVVMDMETGEILYHKNMHDVRAPASLTKIVTTMIALQEGDLQSLVEVSSHAAAVGGSSLHLSSGDTLPLKDLLYGMMITSGNDAAQAVAEHVSGSAEDFAQLMNDWVRELGAKNSIFKNPHGLPQGGHYTTAYDLALITRAALQNPLFADIVKQKSYKLTYEGLAWPRTINSHNRILWSYTGADGVKTGYTSEAGRCLAASASGEGRQVLVILLNSQNRWEEASLLLDYGLNMFSFYQVVHKGEILFHIEVQGEEIPLYADAGVRLLIPLDKEVMITRSLHLPLDVQGPRYYGEEVGWMYIDYNGEREVVNLCLGTEIQPPSLMQRLQLWFEDLRPKGG